tara:strand:+ start:1340 stop:1441 length:102 start_codon:yes stop_codon:yes gene_type:complete
VDGTVFGLDQTFISLDVFEGYEKETSDNGHFYP